MTMEKIGICLYCGQTKKLIKAHITPKCFYTAVFDSGEKPTQFSSQPNEYPRDLPIGPYDENILCAKCDNKLGIYDDYAKILLFDTPTTKIPLSSFIKIETYDYKIFKLFFLSLLWRASISKEPMYEQVKLGSTHTNRILSMLKAMNPGTADDYSVVVEKFDDPESCVVHLQTKRGRVKPSGIAFYRFSGAGYSFFIKVDSRPTPELFRSLMLAPDSPFLISIKSWEKSMEYDEVLNVVANATESRKGHEERK
jgi:hypothetical protein